MNKIIDGVEYVATTELIEGSCVECVANHDLMLCNKIGRECLDAAIIWKEVKVIKNPPSTPVEEPKYTVDEVLDVAQTWGEGYILNIGIRNQIKQELEVLTSVEYKEFLRLQEKFKGVK